ncbi:MAG: pyridoxal phosphate-dependent aminotransferase, partial [Anaerolineae bacterium]
MHYRRMPIEIESPEAIGYGRIRHNLAESSVTDAVLGDLDLSLKDVVLEYGDHKGRPRLRRMVADDGDGVTPEDVLMTIGAAAALFIVNTSLLKAGDRMVVLHPNYATNVETPRAIGANVVTLPLRFEDGFRLDLDALERALTPETRLLSLTYPHNPTGVMISRADLERIIGLVEANDSYLLFDETYRDMTFGEKLPLAASLSPSAISISSLSKTYGLPGIRMGWLVNRDPSLMETFLAAKEQIFISGSVVDEAIAEQYLARKAEHLARIRAQIASNFALVQTWMAEQTAFEWVEPQGGVVCFPRLKPDVPVDVDRFYTILN